MKRYRDPLAAIEPSRDELPLSERILCGIILLIVVAGAVYVSVVVGP